MSRVKFSATLSVEMRISRATNFGLLSRSCRCSTLVWAQSLPRSHRAHTGFLQTYVPTTRFISQPGVAWSPSPTAAISVVHAGLLPTFQVHPQELYNKIEALLISLEEVVLIPLEHLPMENVSWMSVMAPLESIAEALEIEWGPVEHLNNVKQTPELRDAYSRVLPLLVKFNLRVAQSKEVYQRLLALRNSKNISPVQLRILNKRIQGAEHSGIALNAEVQLRFNALTERLSELSKSLSDNVLDATKAWNLVVDPKTQPQFRDAILNLPEDLIVQASSKYTQSTNNPSTPASGPWSFGLDGPSFISFMENCHISELRNEMYLASISKCSEGPFNNKEIVNEILSCRLEQAQLLGFESFAELSLSNKMAKTPGNVRELLNHLLESSRQVAAKEFQELTEYAASCGTPKLVQSDIGYFAKRLQENKYSYKEEEVRQYLPFPKVRDGLFQLIERLFGVRAIKVNDAAIWNETVEFFFLVDVATNQIVAGFYLDPFARPNEKRGGAWMDVCRTKGVLPNGTSQIPVAYLICNASPPTSQTPSLLTIREVETLFHEFGHGLQHMLTTITHRDVSGIGGVEWDAVEFPSQLMENFFYDPTVFLPMTSHYKTGKSLPLDVYQCIADGRNFRAASQLLRQIRLGLFDLTVHEWSNLRSPQNIKDVQTQIYTLTDFLPPLDQDYFYCSFLHIFAGGYASGYYSYKWAEVLSADAYQEFKRLSDNVVEYQELGRKFRKTVLALGGSDDPLKIFEEFKGNKPDPNSLLRSIGLLS